jgi:DNA polymerase sigma
MERVVCIPAAKVRIVKVWDPELQLSCDMNVNNVAALENTRMINLYVQIDDRVRPLAMIIKHWTKRRILNDAGEFATTILGTLLTRFRHWWHNQLVHLDMHDFELPSNSRSAHITIPAQTT